MVMAVRRWSKEDEEFLVKNYSKLDNNELSDRFGVSKIAIQRKLARLKLLRQYQKKWSQDEERYLNENFLKMSDRELARLFNVTEISIKRKLARLGCKRNLRRKRSSRETGVSIITNVKTRAASQTITSPAVKTQQIPSQTEFHQIPKTPGSTAQLRVKAVAHEIPIAPACKKKNGHLPPSEHVTEKKVKSAKCQVEDEHYSAFSSYDVGDVIFHKTWNDRGKVTRVIKTSGGHKAIVVDFSKCGQKILLIEVKTEE